MERIPDGPAPSSRSRADERGTLYELPLLVALLIVSLAVGVGLYEPYRWTGLVLGTVLAFAVVVGAMMGLVGLIAGVTGMSRRLAGRPWFPVLRAWGKAAFLFLLFWLWGAVLTLTVSGLFELQAAAGDGGALLLPFLIGVGWMLLFRRLHAAFWPLFRSLSRCLAVGGLAVLAGIMVGPLLIDDPLLLMPILQTVFLLPLALTLLRAVVKGLSGR